jgi:hypothetical protein
MKDDEPFSLIGARLEKVEFDDGRSSLVVSGEFDVIAEVGKKASAAAEHEKKIIEIIKTQFADSGARHGELKKAFVDATGASGSTFDRARKKLKDSNRVWCDRNSKGSFFHVTKKQSFLGDLDKLPDEKSS